MSREENDYTESRFESIEEKLRFQSVVNKQNDELQEKLCEAITLINKILLKNEMEK